MTEIRTFSALVDDTIARSGRPDRKADIISFARQAMREMQVQASFEKDLVEDQITPTVDPYSYTKPTNFRKMRSVRYGQILDPRGRPRYPKFKMPSRHIEQETLLWYSAGNYLVFKGHEITPIDLAYYTYVKPLAYYADADRPAKFILEDDDWTYLTASTAEEQEAAQALVTNWLLFDWYDTCLEGTMAKLFKTYGDQRAGATFALFERLKNAMRHGESRSGDTE